MAIPGLAMRWWKRPGDGIVFAVNDPDHIKRIVPEGWQEVSRPTPDGPAVVEPLAVASATPPISHLFMKPGGSMAYAVGDVEQFARLLAEGYIEIQFSAAIPPAASVSPASLAPTDVDVTVAGASDAGDVGLPSDEELAAFQATRGKRQAASKG